MATYRISGVWKDENDVITHYAIHKLETDHISRASKTSKAAAIKLAEATGNTVTTWIWNYNKSEWRIGRKVEVVNGKTGKYLRSNPDNILTDNLNHLIDYDWILL